MSDIFSAIYIDLFYENLARSGTEVDLPELVSSVALLIREMSRAAASQRLDHLRRRTTDPRTRFRLEAASSRIAAGDELPFHHPADWAASFVMGAPVIHIQEQN